VAQVLVDVDEGTLDVLVDGFIPDATAQMEAASPANAPAPSGQTFVFVHMSVTYHSGRKRDSTTLASAAFSLFGVAGVERKASDCGEIVPDELDTSREVVDGGQLSGNLCFLLPPPDLAGSLSLRASQYLCFRECAEAWFRLR
jgi:hypothetical protein